MDRDKTRNHTTAEAVALNAMVRKHICCWCGKKIKNSNGSTTMLSAPGLGRRYYYNCGCMDRESFMEMSRLLFESGKNLPDKYKDAF